MLPLEHLKLNNFRTSNEFRNIYSLLPDFGQAKLRKKEEKTYMGLLSLLPTPPESAMLPVRRYTSTPALSRVVADGPMDGTFIV